MNPKRLMRTPTPPINSALGTNRTELNRADARRIPTKSIEEDVLDLLKETVHLGRSRSRLRRRDVARAHYGARPVAPSFSFLRMSLKSSVSGLGGSLQTLLVCGIPNVVTPCVVKKHLSFTQVISSPPSARSLSPNS